MEIDQHHGSTWLGECVLYQKTEKEMKNMGEILAALFVTL